MGVGVEMNDDTHVQCRDKNAWLGLCGSERLCPILVPGYLVEP